MTKPAPDSAPAPAPGKTGKNEAAGKTGKTGKNEATGETGEDSGSLPNPLKEISDRARGVGEFIRDQRNTARLSLRNVAKTAGISNPYLSQIERGLRKPSAEILSQIAKALRISAETLYVQAGILEERRTEPEVAEAIGRDPSLTPDQREALLSYYRSLQREEPDE